MSEFDLSSAQPVQGINALKSQPKGGNSLMLDIASLMPAVPQGAVDWANGVQHRMAHPLEALSDVATQWKNMNPVEMASNVFPVGATAWHGSPHLFDKFKSEAIGTGEGAQAYGHGLYLAQKKAIAEDYARKLSGDADLKSLEWGNLPQAREGSMADKLAQKFEYDGQNFRDEDGKFITEHAKEQGAVKHTVNNLDFHVFPDQSYIVDAGQGWDFGQRGEQQLYKTDIPDAHIDKMLDWDKTLSEQHDTIKKQFIDFAFKPGSPYEDYIKTYNPTPQELLREVRGSQFYNVLAGKPKNQSHLLDAPGASEVLSQAGIPGIKYLDGSSRADGEGTRNFVMFNPEDIRILERNGQTTGQQPWDMESAKPVE